MIFIHRPQVYTKFGTHVPDCKSVPFSSSINGMNKGGIGVLSSLHNAVRIVGARINGTDKIFPTPVNVIDRTLYGPTGIFPNASELVGNAMRTMYLDEFSLTDIPFLFTIGWDASLSRNYTAHAIDNSSISGHGNGTAYMIYQLRSNAGVWGSNYGSGTFNVVTTASLAIESDIDPYMRCSLENITDIEIKSLFTTNPDGILLGVKDNPNNLNILLTYVSHLSSAFITQLFDPILDKGVATGCEINNIGTVNMTPTLKLQLQNLGWIVNF